MKDAKELLDKYKAGKCSPEELKILDKWFHHLGEDEPSGLTEDELLDASARLRQNMSVLTRGTRVRRLWFPAVAASAAVIFLISSVIYLRAPKVEQHGAIQHAELTEFGSDVEPGGNSAVLTLSDGLKIDLSEAKNGELASQSGVGVRKIDGELVYNAGSATAPLSSSGQPVTYPFLPTPHRNSFLKTLYNVIETPRGGEYRVTLADGTRVWLNAASTLRYPAVFTGGERRVELQGEAYFEVAPNRTLPFRVESNNQVVEVLGTHFNIASYHDDEVTRTTLVEGRVKVSVEKGFQPRILVPGLQAVVSSSGARIEVKSVDVEEAIAWKNGYFLFNNEDIQSIMRKVSRWYNVDVQYQGNIPEVGFGGTVLKSKNISGVLRVLELTKAVHFKVQGRRVIVMP